MRDPAQLLGPLAHALAQQVRHAVLGDDRVRELARDRHDLTGRELRHDRRDRSVLRRRRDDRHRAAALRQERSQLEGELTARYGGDLT